MLLRLQLQAAPHGRAEPIRRAPHPIQPRRCKRPCLLCQGVRHRERSDRGQVLLVRQPAPRLAPSAAAPGAAAAAVLTLRFVLLLDGITAAFQPEERQPLRRNTTAPAWDPTKQRGREGQRVGE